MSRALPADAATILDGRGNAVTLAQTLHTAFWMHSRDDGTALFLLNEAHREFAVLAAAMGYTITPIEAPITAEVAA